MNPVTQFILRVLSRTARPYLQSYGLLRVKKIFNESALEWQPSDERVVVVAPHMDDEVIGCGGALARHVACGAAVTIVFLTDGRRGGGSGHPDAADLVATRKRESQLALHELGIAKTLYLDGEDGRLAESAGLHTRLRAVLEDVRPDIVYLPFFLEEHPDHRAASSILAAAVHGTAMSFRCHAYEVWTPLFPNCLVRIDATVDAKRRALAHYQSQLAEADYLHTALGLNAFRSSALLGDCRYAEAFCAVSLPQYLDLLASYGGSVPSNESAAT
jgi:LmbE family N-acetylglucosaminyl deacetylase